MRILSLREIKGVSGGLAVEPNFDDFSDAMKLGAVVGAYLGGPVGAVDGAVDGAVVGGAGYLLWNGGQNLYDYASRPADNYQFQNSAYNSFPW